MLESDEIREQISDALKAQHAEYIEVRIEEGEATRIQYRGRELEEIGKTTSLGGNARALVKGGWAFISFNDLAGLRDRVEMAVRQAEMVGGETRLAPAEAMVDIVEPEVKKDPFLIPLADKKRLLDENI